VALVHDVRRPGRALRCCAVAYWTGARCGPEKRSEQGVVSERTAGAEQVGEGPSRRNSSAGSVSAGEVRLKRSGLPEAPHPAVADPARHAHPRATAQAFAFEAGIRRPRGGREC